MVDWVALSVPFIYLGILLGSLYAFSYVYRQRQAQKAASLAPWFPAHTPRNIYLSLLHHEPSNEGDKSAKIPESVLKAALLRRATEDIHRIIAVRNAKQALTTLLQRGCIGDELWQRYQRAEKEMEEELRDVVNEANAFAPGWGQVVFQSANEMANNAMIRKHTEEIQSQVAAEKEWWEKRKAAIQSDFMKELADDAQKGALASPTSTTSSITGTAKSRASGGGSEDDTVLVEGGGPQNQQGGGGGKKKKKGKK